MADYVIREALAVQAVWNTAVWNTGRVAIGSSPPNGGRNLIAEKLTGGAKLWNPPGRLTLSMSSQSVIFAGEASNSHFVAGALAGSAVPVQ